jgi:hypothetical protein
MLSAMHALRAHVENGRIVVDEPTDLPEGTEVKVRFVEGPEALDDEERAALHEKLRDGFDAIRAGRTVPLEKLKSKLLSRP